MVPTTDMRRFWIAFLVIIPIASLTGPPTLAATGDVECPNEYLPLTIGAQWRYKISSRKSATRQFSVRAVRFSRYPGKFVLLGHAEEGSEPVVTLFACDGSDLRVEPNDVTDPSYAIQLYPIPALFPGERMPKESELENARVDSAFTSRFVGAGQTKHLAKGRIHSIEPAHVDAPAGSFASVAIHRYVRDATARRSTSLTIKSYLVKGVGLVRAEYHDGRTIELIDYRPAESDKPVKHGRSQPAIRAGRMMALVDSPIVASADPSSCRAEGAPGFDGTTCPSLFWNFDSRGAHFPVGLGLIDVKGIVNAGRCGNDGPLPREAGGDDCMVHDDRDVNFNVTPDPMKPEQFTEWNFWGDADEHGKTDFEVEWEWMYFFPPFDKFPNATSDNWWGFSLAPNRNPSVSFYGDVPQGGVPWKGDSIAVRGIHVLDCGHSDGPGNTARAEIHPPMVIAWLHPTEGVQRSGLVWIRASSFATDPHRHYPFGGPFEATFEVPGGAVPGQTVQVGPVTLDWMHTDYTTDNVHSCEIGDFQSPVARLANGTLDESYVDYFNFETSIPDDHHITVRLWPKGDAHWDNDYPDLIGLHFRVCIPACNEECAGPDTLNDCPSTTCPPPRRR